MEKYDIDKFRNFIDCFIERIYNTLPGIITKHIKLTPIESDIISNNNEITVCVTFNEEIIFSDLHSYIFDISIPKRLKNMIEESKLVGYIFNTNKYDIIYTIKPEYKDDFISYVNKFKGD